MSLLLLESSPAAAGAAGTSRAPGGVRVVRRVGEVGEAPLEVVPGQVLEAPAVGQVLRDRGRAAVAPVSSAAVRARQAPCGRRGGAKATRDAAHCPASLLAFIGLGLLEKFLELT